MHKQLNILFITDGITPFVTGGMQKSSEVFSKLFASRGHKITLVHCGYIGQKTFDEKYDNVFTPEELNFITPVFIPFLNMGKLPGHYIKENKAYSNRIKKHIGNSLSQYDIIYAKGYTAHAFLNNKENIPVLVNLHGYEMYQKAPNIRVKLSHYLLRPITKETIEKANFVLSYGGKIDTILSNLGVPKEKIIRHSNGITQDWITTETPTKQNPTTFTFVGRFERRKGIEELTLALKKLLLTDLDFSFNFIGPIPKEHQIKHHKIKYTGAIKDANRIKKLLDQSDFLVCPSYAEGMPTVIIEAMARGNAIIATDVGATSKLINNNGWLIKPTPASILKHLVKAINLNSKQTIQLKENSIKHAKDNFIYNNFIDLQIAEIRKKCLN